MMTPESLLKYLREQGVDASIREFDAPVRTVAAASALSGVSRKGIVKTLVVVDSKGTPYLCLVPGHRRLSLSKAAKALGVPEVRLARPEEVLRETGYEASAVPPVGHRSEMRVLMDTELARLDRMVAGGGSNRALLEISPEDVRRVTGGELADLSEA